MSKYYTDYYGYTRDASKEEYNPSNKNFDCSRCYKHDRCPYDFGGVNGHDCPAYDDGNY